MSQEHHTDTDLFFKKTILQGINLLYFVFNYKTKKFDIINDAFQNIWGTDKSLYLKNPDLLLDTIVKDDRNYLIQKFETLFDGKVEEYFEFKIMTSNDQKKWVSLRIYAYKTSDGIIENIYGYGEDITLRKDYELNLLNINERKNNVLQIVGHDLRGPLENLKSFTNLLEKEYEAQEFKDFKTYIKFMKQTCESSINLISELLTMEYMLSDQVELKLSRVELVSKIKIIFETYVLANKNLNKNFILESSNEKVYLEVDELKFMLIFSNLISNAYKFTKETGNITVGIEEGEDNVIISVEDNGIGIPEKLQPFIFEKFSKARRPGMQGEKPVGLGLHIIKYMVELHKGKIWFESKENKGTKFFVEIPRLLSILS
jgi:two-component system sensor histidine kinase VicK